MSASGAGDATADAPESMGGNRSSNLESERTESGVQRAAGAAGSPGEEFVRVFTQSQRALYLFILPLVSCAADAEEVLQETNVVIWSKWTQFEPGTNFVAWGRAIARLEVFRFRRRRGHRLQLLGDDVVELLAREVSEQPNDFDVRRDALAMCVSKLREKDRRLIQMRYAVDTTGDDVAQALGRPANSVYQSVGRIRRILMECVRRQMTAMETTG